MEAQFATIRNLQGPVFPVSKTKLMPTEIFQSYSLQLQAPGSQNFKTAEFSVPFLTCKGIKSEIFWQHADSNEQKF